MEKCQNCGNESTMFNRASTVVNCGVCESILAEPAGAVAAAAFLSKKVNIDLITVAAVTGGNVTDEMVLAMKKMLD